MTRDVKEQHFWVKADPEIDARMLATNRKRDVFDIDTFVSNQISFHICNDYAKH
jgi:hypothetical protein